MTIVPPGEYMPPQPGYPLVLPVQYVGWWRRAAARLIDLVYTNIIVLFSAVFLGFLLAFLDIVLGTDYVFQVQHIDPSLLVNLLAGFLALTTYTTLCEGIYGSTLGKLILGIVVLGDDFTPCSVLQGLLRALAMVIDGLFFGVVAALVMSDSPQKKRLGDRWARAVVVRTPSAPRESKRSGFLFVIAFLLGSLLSIFLSVLPTLIMINW